MEFDNVRDALEMGISTNQAKQSDFKIDGVEATYDDLRDWNKEALYNIADLLGMSDLYLK